MVSHRNNYLFTISHWMRHRIYQSNKAIGVIYAIRFYSGNIHKLVQYAGTFIIVFNNINKTVYWWSATLLKAFLHSVEMIMSFIMEIWKEIPLHWCKLNRYIITQWNLFAYSYISLSWTCTYFLYTKHKLSHIT